jgi:hypothetical protein
MACIVFRSKVAVLYLSDSSKSLSLSCFLKISILTGFMAGIRFKSAWSEMGLVSGILLWPREEILVSESGDILSRIGELLSGGGALLSGGGALLSGGRALLSGSGALLSGGAALLSGGGALLSGSGALLSGGAALLSGGGALRLSLFNLFK